MCAGCVAKLERAMRASCMAKKIGEKATLYCFSAGSAERP